MPSLFSRSGSRFASSGVIEILPSEIIDSIWFVIDADLQGFYELNDLLVFELKNNFGNLTFRFTQDSEITTMDIDTKFGYFPFYPSKIFVGDDGNKQTIFLPKEFKTE